MPTAEASSPHIVTPTLPAWGRGFDELRAHDPELADILLGEAQRQASCLQLIAGENFTSPAVLTALGSPLANKYAEGYPGHRHHAGCELVDLAERLAVERATRLFGAAHANVQPYSGSSAVLAAYPDHALSYELLREQLTLTAPTKSFTSEDESPTRS